MNGEIPHSPESSAELTEREKVLVGVWENMALDYVMKEKLHDPNMPEDLTTIAQAISNQYGIPLETVQGYQALIHQQMIQAYTHFRSRD